MFYTLLSGVLSCLCWIGESQQAGGATTSALYRAVQFMTSLVGVQLIGLGSTIGRWRRQTPHKLGEGTTLPAAFTPHACQAIVL
jgi:hypothetical protein